MTRILRRAACLAALAVAAAVPAAAQTPAAAADVPFRLPDGYPPVARVASLGPGEQPGLERMDMFMAMREAEGTLIVAATLQMLPTHSTDEAAGLLLEGLIEGMTQGGDAEIVGREARSDDATVGEVFQIRATGAGAGTMHGWGRSMVSREAPTRMSVVVVFAMNSDGTSPAFTGPLLDSIRLVAAP